MTALTNDLDRTLAFTAERATSESHRRQLDSDVVAALAAAGINRMLLPRQIGGVEADPRDVVKTIARVAAADASTGWCTANSVADNIFSGHVARSAAEEMYADPDVGMAGMFAPLGVVTQTRRADGHVGNSLSGRWPFVSNCLHSRWIGLGAVIRAGDDVDPMPRVVFVPTADVTIEDTWNACGLEATGSHHVRVDNLEVDLDRSTTFAGSPWTDGPLWQMPLFTVLLPVLVAAPLGMARSAVDVMLDRLARGGGGASRGELADDPVGIAELATADAALRAAHAGVIDAVGDVWETALQGERASRVLQARCMLAVQHAVDVAVESVSVAHRLCGGAATYSGHPVLTALLDVHIARQHISFAHQFRARLGRMSAGIDEVAPPFIV
jgi:alkylation response protein AidB-like acyl-CoA dehydrogenase